jgi:hypothetical protein
MPRTDGKTLASTDKISMLRHENRLNGLGTPVSGIGRGPEYQEKQL